VVILPVSSQQKKYEGHLFAGDSLGLPDHRVDQ
jgi:hypothetical protein